jgi:hypothetical protein
VYGVANNGVANDDVANDDVADSVMVGLGFAAS